MLHLNNINLCWINLVLLATFGANDHKVLLATLKISMNFNFYLKMEFNTVITILNRYNFTNLDFLVEKYNSVRKVLKMYVRWTAMTGAHFFQNVIGTLSTPDVLLCLKDLIVLIIASTFIVSCIFWVRDKYV